MNEITRFLSATTHDDENAAAALLPLVYEELRKLAAQRLAREKSGQTLQGTALVHEAYLRPRERLPMQRIAVPEAGHHLAPAGRRLAPATMCSLLPGPA